MTRAQTVGFSKTSRIFDYQARRDQATGDDKVTPENDKILPRVTVDDTENVTFRQIAEWTGEKSNTISARYFPKVVMAHEGLKGYPSLQSAPGKPTGYAAKCIAEFLDCEKNLEAFVTRLKKRYSKPSSPTVTSINGEDDTVIHAEMMDDDTVSSGDRSEIAGKLALRKEQSEDDTDSVIGDVSLTIQLFKEQEQDFFGSEEERLYAEAYQRKLAELGKGLKLKLIERKAALDAEKDFKEMLEETDS